MPTCLALIKHTKNKLFWEQIKLGGTTAKASNPNFSLLIGSLQTSRE